MYVGAAASAHSLQDLARSLPSSSLVSATHVLGIRLPTPHASPERGGLFTPRRSPPRLTELALDFVARHLRECVLAATRTKAELDMPVELYEMLLGRMRAQDQLSDAALEILLDGRMRHLALSGVSVQQVSDEGLASIPWACAQLRVLDLSNCNQLSDATVRLVLQRCRELRALSLRGCRGIKDLALNVAVESELQSVDLSGTSIGDVGIRCIAQACPLLRQLNVSGCPITDKGLYYLCCEKTIVLQSIGLANCSGVTDTGVCHIAFGSAGSLEELVLTKVNRLSDFGLQKIGAACHNLRVLYIQNCAGVTDTGIEAIARGCRRLSDLNLAGCSQVGERGVLALAECCQELTKVNLFACRATSAAVEALRTQCRGLESVSVWGCPEVKRTRMARRALSLGE